MQTTFKFFASFIFCSTLALVSGCGGVSAPALTPAEQADVDKYMREYGTNALAYFSLNDMDEQLALKYVKYFVSQGVNVNAKHIPYDDTPLHTAVASGHVKVVKFLVAQGANVNAKGRSNHTPLDVASGNDKNKAIAEYLKSIAIVFSSTGGLVFGNFFDHFVFPFFVVFDESVSDDEHFVHVGGISLLHFRNCLNPSLEFGNCLVPLS